MHAAIYKEWKNRDDETDKENEDKTNISQGIQDIENNSNPAAKHDHHEEKEVTVMTKGDEREITESSDSGEDVQSIEINDDDNSNSNANDPCQDEVKENQDNASISNGNITEDNNTLQHLQEEFPANNNCCNKRCNNSRCTNRTKEKLKSFWKFIQKYISRLDKYKSIYITGIVHFVDVLTDYLVLCQYVMYAIEECNGKNYENIDYVVVSISSFLIIVLSKIISCWYVYKFTENGWKTLLNFLDGYIYVEIFQSHKTGNKNRKNMGVSPTIRGTNVCCFAK